MSVVKCLDCGRLVSTRFAMHECKVNPFPKPSTESPERRKPSQFSELHKAYLAGKRAARKGLAENPYPVPAQQGDRSFSQHGSWKRGWLAGKKEGAL